MTALLYLTENDFQIGPTKVWGEFPSTNKTNEIPKNHTEDDELRKAKGRTDFPKTPQHFYHGALN